MPVLKQVLKDKNVCHEEKFFFTFSNISPEPGTRVMIHVNVDCVNEVNAITDA